MDCSSVTFSFPSSKPLHLLTGGLVVFNLLARNVVKLTGEIWHQKRFVWFLWLLCFHCGFHPKRLGDICEWIFFCKLYMSKIQSSTVLSKLFQSSRVFLVEGIEWNWSSIDQQHQSLGDRSTCFFHVLDMLGILKVVELKESKMIEIRCLNYQLCHLSPHVVTYLTPKNANNKNIHHLVAFLSWPRINLWPRACSCTSHTP